VCDAIHGLQIQHLCPAGLRCAAAEAELVRKLAQPLKQLPKDINGLSAVLAEGCLPVSPLLYSELSARKEGQHILRKVAPSKGRLAALVTSAVDFALPSDQPSASALSRQISCFTGSSTLESPVSPFTKDLFYTKCDMQAPLALPHSLHVDSCCVAFLLGSALLRVMPGPARKTAWWDLHCLRVHVIVCPVQTPRKGIT
jgi:hypothetical protein